MYYEDSISNIKQTILYQMKEYTFDFKGDKFSLDIVQETKNTQLFKIHDCEEGLCAYFEMPTKGPYLLKVIYDKEKFDKLHQDFLVKLLKFNVIVLFLLLFISIGFAMYSINPMKRALYLLEEFLKDLIHDLNTPATSILLNAKLLRKRGDFEELERIELSAKVISSLYKNLQILKFNKIVKNENVSLVEIIEEKVELLKKLYPRIEFITKMKPLHVRSDKYAMSRIIDNLLTNACKYNKRDGKVNITIKESKVLIEDTGIGIRNTKKVYQRYYKENDRGLGIGMSIVKQLCDELNISIFINSELGKGTVIELTIN